MCERERVSEREGQGETLVCVCPPSLYIDLHTQAKMMLEKALAQEPSYLEAVYLLAEVLTEEHQYTAAIEL